MNSIEQIGTILVSFLITVAAMPSFINYFRSRNEGQMIREEGPKWHEKKSGTPTMGGLIFIVAISLSSLLFEIVSHQINATVVILIVILIMYGFLGFWDDSIKLMKKQNEGLKAWQKFLGQVVGAVIFYFVYVHEGFAQVLNLPWVGGWHLGAWFALFVIFWLVGFSNAVNLSDGLDGLVSGLAIIAFGAYAIIAAVQNQFDVLIFCLAIIGALLGFFIFNHKPAKIFMGDMGSLALGGALAAVSILVHHEAALLLIGVVFVCETASVILQVASFKLTGHRIFKMSPIHHHFEMLGWSEWKVDIVFWCVGLIGAMIALIGILN